MGQPSTHRLASGTRRHSPDVRAIQWLYLVVDFVSLCDARMNANTSLVIARAAAINSLRHGIEGISSVAAVAATHGPPDAGFDIIGDECNVAVAKRNVHSAVVTAGRSHSELPACVVAAEVTVVRVWRLEMLVSSGRWRPS